MREGGGVFAGFYGNIMLHIAGGTSPFQPSYQYRPYYQPGYPPAYNRPQGINDNSFI